jgi:hypothetical protein
VGEIAKVLRGDVLKRRDHAHALARERLDGRNRGAALGQLHHADLGRHQRHGGVDEDLALELGEHLFHGCALGGVGNGQDRDLGGGRRGAVVGARDRLADARRQLRRGIARPRRIARADGHRVAGGGQAQGEAAALRARAAEDRDLVSLPLH